MSSRRINLQVKLLGLAAVLLAFGALIGFLAIGKLGSVDRLGVTTYEHGMVPLTGIGEARARLGEIDSQIQNAIIAKSAASRQVYAGKSWGDAKYIEAAWARYRRIDHSAEERRTMAAFDAKWRAYKPAFHSVLTAAGAGRSAEATRDYFASAKPLYADVDKVLAALAQQSQMAGKANTAHMTAAYHSGRSAILVLIVLALASGFGLSWFIASRVKRGVNDVRATLGSLEGHCIAGLQGGLRGLATGDLTIEVTPVTPLIERLSNDEIGDIARTVNAIREATVASVGEYNATRAALGAIASQLSATAESVSAASLQMASMSEETGRAVGEIAHAVSDVAQGAEKQARTVDSARRVSEEIVTATATSAENAERTVQAAVQAREVAEQGAEAVGEATAAMEAVRGSSAQATQAIRELGAKSEQIGGIVSTITGISEQTNLLALNAAIEAARAGDQGRGFAVVAEEVRKLAEESQAAAATIAGLIDQIQTDTAHAVEVVETGARETDTGAATVDRVREAFVAIGDSIQSMHGQVGDISDAVQHIASSSAQMQTDMADVAAIAEQSSASTEQVSASTQETSASAQEMASSARQLAGNATDLEQLVARFQVAHA
jgi:methyl-accepting chemotaxis protein